MWPGFPLEVYARFIITDAKGHGLVNIAHTVTCVSDEGHGRPGDPFWIKGTLQDKYQDCACVFIQLSSCISNPISQDSTMRASTDQIQTLHGPPSLR